jgi:hypothetical protein
MIARGPQFGLKKNPPAGVNRRDVVVAAPMRAISVELSKAAFVSRSGKPYAATAIARDVGRGSIAMNWAWSTRPGGKVSCHNQHGANEERWPFNVGSEFIMTNKPAGSR